MPARSGMRFKSLASFRRGAFENEGVEERIPIDFLLKLHNADSDITGKVSSRRGYDYWADLLEGNSIPSSFPDGPDGENNLPVVQAGTIGREQAGFQGLIQRIFQYTDVVGQSFIGIVSDGRIFIETLEENGRQWSCLTPNLQFQAVDKHIDVVAYLDLLFFNDVGKNIYYYDSQTYKEKSGWLSLGNSFMYFAADKVYYRDYGTLDAGSSVTIENLASNIEGKAIWDGLDAIGYPYKNDLKLGYCLRVGNESIGIKYFVLDNAKNQRADDKCQIIRFDENLIAEDFIEFDINPAAEILNIDYYIEDFGTFGHVYIFCEDGVVYKINETNLEATRIENDIYSAVAPTNDSGKKQYSITVNSEGIFVYSVELPDKDDWWQPIIIDELSVDNPDRNPATIFYPGNPLILPLSSQASFPFGLDHISDENVNMNTRYFGPRAIGTFLFSGANITLDNRSFAEKLNIMNFKKTITDSDLAADTFLWSGAPTQYKRKYSLNYYWNTVGVPSENVLYDIWGARHYLMYEVNKGWNQQKLKYHPFFGYDKENATPADQQIYSGTTTLLRETQAMYLLDQDYNTSIFSSKTVSDYVLLLGFKHDGFLKEKEIDTIDEDEKQWRYIVPLGKHADIKNVVPLISDIFDDQDYIYFGTDMKDSGSAVNHGKYIELNLQTFEIESDATSAGARRLTIQGDTRWFNYDDGDDKYKINASWELPGTLGQNDYTNLDSYYSNIVFHIKKQVIDYTGNVQIDKLQLLGTPNIPNVSVSYDAGTSMDAGTQFRYYVAFQFFGGNTTVLSPASFPITIPANGKIIISGLNHRDIHGFDIYAKEDIEFIQLYRSQKDVDTDFWTEPNLIATLSLDGGDWYYNPPANPYPKETFEDDQQTYAYNPFTGENEISYAANAMFLHRERLVLVKNNNTIQYSDVDRARAISDDNVRSIEAGDGFNLIGGCSAENYAYLFKEKRIYAILGDVFDGQIIDVSRTTGTRYKNMIISHGGVVFFMNDDGIYTSAAGRPPKNLMQDRIKNYFVKDRGDSIDFEHLGKHGIVRVDTENNEIRFIVPQKDPASDVVRNNLHIIYNIERDHFKTKSYYHNIFDEAYIRNIATEEYQYLMADYEGNIVQLSNSKNDDGKKIRYMIRTKEINLQTSTIAKLWKIIKFAGEFLTSIKIMYWIDGERFNGDVYYRDAGAALTKIWLKGRAQTIVIEISGERLNEPPIEIKEILLGYSRARGLK
jgi:hypothetical protein